MADKITPDWVRIHETLVRGEEDPAKTQRLFGLHLENNSLVFPAQAGAPSFEIQYITIDYRDGKTEREQLNTHEAMVEFAKKVELPKKFTAKGLNQSDFDHAVSQGVVMGDLNEKSDDDGNTVS